MLLTVRRVMKNSSFELSKEKKYKSAPRRQVRSMLAFLAISVGAASCSTGEAIVKSGDSSPSTSLPTTKSTSAPKTHKTHISTPQQGGIVMPKVDLCNLPSLNNEAGAVLSAPVSDLTCSNSIDYSGAFGEANWNITGSQQVAVDNVRILIEPDKNHGIPSLWNEELSQLNSGQFPADILTSATPVNGKPALWAENSILTTPYTRDELVAVAVFSSSVLNLNQLKQDAEIAATIVENQAL